MISNLAWTALAWLLILPASFSLGSITSNCIPFKNQSLRGICYVAAGFVFLSYLIVALSYSGFLKPAAIWILLGIFFLLNFLNWKEFSDWFKSWSDLFQFSKDALHNALIFTALLSIAGLLAGTLTPEIGGDTLTYQLDLPKEFLRRGSLQPILYNDNSLFPLLMNNLYLIGLATGGVFAAKLFHFSTSVLMSLTLARLVTLKTQNPKLGLFSGLTLLITPAVFNLASTTYIDVAVGFYIFLALAVLIDSFETDFPAGAFLSGLFGGAAVATKYLSLTGLSAVAAVGFIYCGLIKKRALKACLTPAAFWALGVFIACGYWLLRNWTLTGNPFYPYWGQFFGGAQRPEINYFDTGMGKNLLAYFSAVTNAALFPDKFGAMTTRISPVYTLTLLLGIFAAFRNKPSRPYFFFFVFFYTIWFRLVQLDRWFISALPALLLCGAAGFQTLNKPVLKRFLAAMGLILLLIEVLAGLYHYRHAYLLDTAQWSLQEYSRKMERTVPAAEWINTNLPQDAVLLLEAEPRKFYIQRKMIEDKNLDWHTQYHQKTTTPYEAWEFLKQEGVTHLLMSDSVTRGVEEPALLRPLISAGFADLLKEIPSENIRDERFIYRVYKLKT